MATVTFIKYEKQSAGALGGVAAYVSQIFPLPSLEPSSTRTRQKS